MFSARLIELRRTTSFRQALRFAGLFGFSSLFLFGFLYWQTIGYVSSLVDEWLLRETAMRGVTSATDLANALNLRVAGDPDGRRPMTLFGADGSWRAGSAVTLPASLPAMDRPFHVLLPRGGEAAPFRGMIHKLSSGEILLVARDMRDINQFHELLLAAMGSGALVVLLLGLSGAVIMGAGALGQFDGIAGAIEKIVDGDLSQRLPSGGTAGDLDRLIQVVNRMLDDIERLMHEVKGATDEIAHDLRTPLTRLLAGLERARRRATSVDEYDAAVDEAIGETRAMLVTFGALLRIAEVEAGARRAGFTTLDLNTVAADVIDFYEPLAERKGVSLTLQAENAPAELAGDPSLVFEAMGNLIDNAIKFTPAGGRATLRISRDRNQLGIEVSDSGPGIPETERELVLRRFHRAE